MAESTTRFSVLESLFAAGEAARKAAEDEALKTSGANQASTDQAQTVTEAPAEGREPKAIVFESGPLLKDDGDAVVPVVGPSNTTSSVIDEFISNTNPAASEDTSLPLLGGSGGSVNATVAATNETAAYDEYDYSSYDAPANTDGQTTTTESNPFFSNDYDWYAYNEVPEGVEYAEYTDYDREVKRNETLALFENIGKAPPIRDVLYVARDLDPNFLVLPPLVAMALLALAFMPCVILKWRDDIREMCGKTRVYGPRTRRLSKTPLEDVEAAVSVVDTISTRGGSPAGPSGGTRLSPVSASSQRRDNIPIRHLNARDLRSGDEMSVMAGLKDNDKISDPALNSSEENLSNSGSSSTDIPSDMTSSRSTSGNSQNGGRSKREHRGNNTQTNYGFESSEKRFSGDFGGL